MKTKLKYTLQILFAAAVTPLLFSSFSPGNTNPQAKADFASINNAYEKAGKYSMNITYKLYTDYTTLIPVETEKGTASRNGKSFYSKMFNIETIRDEKLTLSIDHEDKIMIVDDYPKKPQNEAFLAMSVDTLLSACSEVTMKDISASSRSWKLSFSEWKYSSVEIIFNRKTFFIEKLVLYFRQAIKLDEENPAAKEEKPRIEITYSQVSTTSAPAQVSVSKYITKKMGDYVANNPFADYKVLYHKQEKP